MTSYLLSVEPFDLVVFGGTGDLANRKLYPALYRRFVAGQFTLPTRIIGIARHAMSREAFQAAVSAALEAQIGAKPEQPSLSRFLDLVHFIAVDALKEDGWADLAAFLGGEASPRVRAYYLATAPELFGPIAERLQVFGLATPTSRVIVEKPIGKDLVSARHINDAQGVVFQEHQIFRIDHYLGKETVQNLMALRFANALFEPLWNSAHIDHVQITASEALGVEARGAYYDASGALRDMVQNHLLQLLCLIAIEPPNSLSADAVRDEKRKVLAALAPITTDNAAQLTVRGQYRPGAIDGMPVPGYLQECGDPGSKTETFVAIKASINNWRWASVPFYLRTGKRLAQRVTEIVVTFRHVPFSIFDAQAGHIAPTRLVIRLQPGEGIRLELMIKEPGPGGMRLKQVPLDMTFAETFPVGAPDAYERLLLDVIRGNATLFMRRDEVEAAWAWIDPIREAWAQSDEAPRPYTAGTWGPSTAVALIERDGRTWAEERV